MPPMDPRAAVRQEPEGYAFAGYMLQEDLTLQPNFDEEGNLTNPNLTLTPNVFCDVCKTIMSEVEGWHKAQASKDYDTEETETLASLPFYDSKDEIKRSTERGCCTCALFLATEQHIFEPGNMLYEFYKPPSSIPDSLQSWVAFGRHSSDSYIRQMRRDRDYNEGISVDFNMNLELEGHGDPLVASAQLSASNASKATFTLVSSWLNNCLSEHCKCQQGQRTDYRSPKRLLDVGDVAHPQLQIVYPQAPAQYLTVSHCWGNFEGLRLDASTKKRLTEGFIDRDLPQLFRDCVQVTRCLRFRYLWIDTLCILQDNEEDMNEEIYKMGDIYQGSVCNIAAVSAPNCEASLFTKFLPLSMTKATLQGSLDKSVSVTVDRVDIDIPMPLYFRAWVIQERVLAFRTLEYTLAGVRWRCGEASQGDEEKTVDTSFEESFHDISRGWSWLLELNSTALSEEEKRRGQTWWMAIVTRYTMSALTYEKDRISALLGIISILQRRNGLSIFHGVCKEFFPYSLLWQMEQGIPRDSQYPVPSWSSTFRSQYSWQATSTYDGQGVQLYCSDFSVDELTSSLSLKAKCWSSRMIKTDPISQDSYYKRYLVQASDGSWKNALFHVENKYAPTVSFNMDYLTFPPTEVDLILLLHTLEVDDDKGEAFGLVVSKLPSENGLWERLGIFKLFAYEDANNMMVNHFIGHFQETKTYRIR